MKISPHGMSRREFVPLVLGSLLRSGTAAQRGPARWSQRLNSGWLCDGAPVTLPHCAAKLSWQDWDPAAWSKISHYRRPLAIPAEARQRRVFLEFDGVMTGSTPAINGHSLPEHLGGYLPFRYEITEWLKPEGNVLDVAVDSTWRNVPPEGSPRGPQSIDYLEPGGMVRGARLCAVPQLFLSDVFAKPVHVLDEHRAVEVTCTVDAAVAAKRVEIRAQLMDGAAVLAHAQQAVAIERAGTSEVSLTLAKPGNIALWSPDSPRLYDVVTTLLVDGQPVHDASVRIGFREARFDPEGFFLNGKRLRIFGLNRHELFPFVGGAMPDRVMRRDAEILRREFNCNTVRCSHYPQTEAFLDRCDELGLMVWEEMPGWQYLGDAVWQELAVRDVGDMIRRDRNHAAIVIWGVRINESNNSPELYELTRELAHRLDSSRPTSGSMTRHATDGWRQDVFAFDDYHGGNGEVAIFEPLPGVPYMLAEAVGQFDYTRGKYFNAKYRLTVELELQQAQALRHAQAHDKALGQPRNAGVIAWCAFDYGSLMNSYRAVKYPGVADVFRIPKLGAAFYQTQVSPRVRPVIAPDFYWDFGPKSPHGPGKDAAIFSNCERLELWLDGKRIATVDPARARFPHLAYPPFLCDLTVDGADLRIDGLAGGNVVVSRSFSADASKDRLTVSLDDREIAGDGSDATRFVFAVTDRFGAPRPFAEGVVTLEITGPAAIVGDNPFPLADSGGKGAVWIRSKPNSAGRVVLKATHSTLGAQSATLTVAAARG